MLYLAYGSNLNNMQMKERCPNAKYIAKGYLTGYKLLFKKKINCLNSYATIKEDKNSVVPYVIYDLTKTDENELDRYEGVSRNLYFKKYINVEKYKNVLVYIQNKGIPCYPEDKYINTCRQGYKDYSLDEKYLNAALAEIKK